LMSVVHGAAVVVAALFHSCIYTLAAKED
jgi:hypothetical protein